MIAHRVNTNCINLCMMNLKTPIEMMNEIASPSMPKATQLFHHLACNLIIIVCAVRANGMVKKRGIVALVLHHYQIPQLLTGKALHSFIFMRFVRWGAREMISYFMIISDFIRCRRNRGKY